jgi:hypothetical protein
MAELHRLADQYAATGLYPILLGDNEDYVRVGEGMEEAFEAPAIVQESYGIEPSKWLQKRFELDPDIFQAEEGDWPAVLNEPIGMMTHLDIVTGKPKQDVVIGLLRLASPWEAFAFLNWGGWNECPFPTEHCAMHRYWESKYGAKVVSVTADIVQCAVARPPLDRAAALHLAREQYIYCCDIVDQGTITISALAASLLNSQHWYFWWD